MELFVRLTVFIWIIMNRHRHIGLNFGLVGEDMESGALFTVGRLRGIETLSILNNVVAYGGDLQAGSQ
jgi:uridine phosphorylase